MCNRVQGTELRHDIIACHINDVSWCLPTGGDRSDLRTRDLTCVGGRLYGCSQAYADCLWHNWLTDWQRILTTTSNKTRLLVMCGRRGYTPCRGYAPWFFLRLWRFINHLLTYSFTLTYMHRFLCPMCCPTSPSLPKFKNLVGGNRPRRLTCRPCRPTGPISSFGRGNRCA